MKKRILSLFLALTLCLTLLPTSAFAEGGDVSISGGVIGGETGGEGGGVPCTTRRFDRRRWWDLYAPKWSGRRGRRHVYPRRRHADGDLVREQARFHWPQL